MKLALIAYLHGSGGAERQIILLGNEMVKRGHQVYMIVLAQNNSPYFIDKRIKIVDCTNIEHYKGFNIFFRYYALRRALASIRPDITIHYNLQSAYFSTIMPKCFVGKNLYSERGDPYDDEYTGLLGIVRDWTIKRIDALVCQSEGARDFFHLSRNQKSIVIHNSVTVPQEKYPVLRHNDRDNRIVTVGRLHHQKNPWLLIDAFAIIANRFPDITLDFYGDGHLKNELQEKIDFLGLHDRIRLNPSRKDIFDCIYAARLFVLPSDFEGMPNALMEAMSLGLPCIAADCRPGGARTLINSGVNGIIVPVRDPQTMADRIIYLLENPNIAEEIALQARMIGLTHTNEATFTKWEDFLSNL